MSDESITQERANGELNPGQKVQRDVQRVIGHLQSNRTSTNETEKLRDAATKSLSDRKVFGSIGR